MSISKKYFYDGDQIYEQETEADASTLAEEILNDPELPEVTELIIGCWGECYDNNVQPILDMMAENKEKFQHVEHLFVGDMEYDECEVSWIEQGDYSALWSALPHLKRLTIKGCNDGLRLGTIDHGELESLEIICGGLRKDVIEELAAANLPNLTRLNLYLGVEDYGFDGDIETIRDLLKARYIRNLRYLGLGDSEIQDEVVEEVLSLGSLFDIRVLDFSNGTLTDKGGKLLLDHAAKLRNLEKLDLTHHYLSDGMMKRLVQAELPVVLEDQQEADEYDGELWMYPMLTE